MTEKPKPEDPVAAEELEKKEPEIKVEWSP